MAVKDFYTNVAMREAVRNYIMDCIEKEAIEMVFDRKDVSHVADAKELLSKAFERMEADFGAKPKTINLNSAR